MFQTLLRQPELAVVMGKELALVVVRAKVSELLVVLVKVMPVVSA